MKARRILALCVVLSANAAAQPCATMAEEHDCPHCPTEHHESGHHGHGEPAKPCCDALDAPCGETDDSNVDGRSGQLKPLDAGDSSVLVAQEYSSIPGEHHGVLPCATGPPFNAAASPPLHILNCAFLK